jgi:hypothetical protein
LVSVVALAGCGVLPTAEEIVDALAQSELASLTLEDAARLLLPEAEDALTDLDDEDALGDVEAELGGIEPNDGTSVALAPAAGDGEPTVTRTVDTGLRGRPLSADILIESASGPRAKVRHELAWIWSSGLDDSGDLNDAAPVDRGGPHGWRRIDAQSETTWRTREGDGVTSVTVAMRRDHTDPAVHAFRTAVTAMAPDHDKAPWRRMESFGEFGLAATGVGHFSRRVEFRDDSVDAREWSIAVSDDVLAIDYARSGPDGMVAEGEGEWATGGTPRCPLDDEGQWTLTRQFPDQGTEPARPVAERVLRTQDGTVTVVNGELDLADGRTLTRTVTWTVEAPVDCSERPTELRISFEGVGYGGAARSGSIVRTADSWERSTEVDLPDGRSVETLVVRSGGTAVITVRHLRADGSLSALLELTTAPGGPAQGTLTQFDESGEIVAVIDVERELDGRYRLRRPEGEELRWRQGQR